MPGRNTMRQPWDRTSRPSIKGNIVIAFMFIVAITAVFGLLSAAYGAETRDGFQPLGVPLGLGRSPQVDNDRAADAVDESPADVEIRVATVGQ